MKKNLFMTAAAIAALLTGCSTDEEIANIETSAKNAIGFNIVSNSAETKATIYGPNSKDFGFDVFAFDNLNNYFMGKEGEHGYTQNADHSFTHDGVQIIPTDAGTWVYKNTEEVAYWPTTNSLNFYAVSPTNFSKSTSVPFTWSIKPSTKTISYSTVDEFNNKEGNKNMDVMYAVAENQVKGTNGGIVKLHFKHILSQVLFKAKVQYEAMTVTIKDMKIHNFAAGGTFTIPEGEPAQSHWGDTTPWLFIYTTKKEKTDISASTTKTEEAVWITPKADPMLFVPQKLTKWETTSGSSFTKKQGDDSKQSYLEIEMKLAQNGQYVIGSENEYKTIYVPFTNIDDNNVTGWEPGKRYIYTLNFGGGYDDQGKPILTPITFDAKVTDWSDASGYTEQIPAYTN